MLNEHSFPTPIRVLLVEDHTLVRDALRTLLQRMDGIEVTAEAADGYEALEVMQKQLPDVVVMDIRMPRLNGFDTTRKVTQAYSHVPVLILTMSRNEEFIARALQNGAAGYLLKDAKEAELCFAIQTVVRGEQYLSPAVTTQVLVDYLLQPHSEISVDMRGENGGLPALSQRQQDILRLVAEGHTTQQIAKRLQLGVKTIETLRIKLMSRIGAHNIAELVQYAVRTGLVSVNE